MEETNTTAIYSKEVLDFVTISTEFNIVMDELHSYTQKQFIEYTLKLLPLLYIKAQLLPTLETEEPESIEKFVSEEEWNKIKLQIEIILGDLDTYKETIGRFEANETNAISENFADIYQDIKDFTNLYNTAVDELMKDAVAEAKRTFTEYWGQRLVNTLKILHFYNHTEELKDKKSEEVQENTEDWLTEQRKNEWEIE